MRAAAEARDRTRADVLVRTWKDFPRWLNSKQHTNLDAKELSFFALHIPTFSLSLLSSFACAATLSAAFRHSIKANKQQSARLHVLENIFSGKHISSSARDKNVCRHFGLFKIKYLRLVRPEMNRKEEMIGKLCRSAAKASRFSACHIPPLFFALHPLAATKSNQSRTSAKKSS